MMKLHYFPPVNSSSKLTIEICWLSNYTKQWGDKLNTFGLDGRGKSKFCIKLIIGHLNGAMNNNNSGRGTNWWIAQFKGFASNLILVFF